MNKFKLHTMRLRLILLIMTATLALPNLASAVSVSNITMGQEGSRAWVRYDLSGELGEREADVTIHLVVGGSRYEAARLGLKGDVGKKVLIGPGKMAIWDVLNSYPGGFDQDVSWEILVAESGSITDSVTGMKLKLVTGGCFDMGDTFGDSVKEGYKDERPVHKVCVDNFYIGKFEVTQGEYQKVMGVNPSNFKQCGANCSVEQVSWDDAQQFITRLNNLTGKSYRLPTEAEWEYAARSGGKKEKFSGGDDIDSVAWYDKNSGNSTHPVGQKTPNGLGLYDMSGNVWEWCSDYYDEGYYKKGPKKGNWKNPQGATEGSNRVLRGGSWRDDARFVRAAYRYYGSPDNRISYLGFRLVSPVQ